MLLALIMEVSHQSNKANQHNDLKDKSNFEKHFAHILLAVGKFEIGPVADSVAVEGFDDRGKPEHSSKHATGMNR